MKLLSNKVVFLTGGSRGIGYDCAKAYATHGAKVVIAALDKEEIDNVISELGPEHHGIVCDISSGDSVRQAIEKAAEKYGRIDVIHNNAGIADPSCPLHETTEEEWDKLMNVNIKSIYYTTRYGIEHLKQSGGCILNTSSMVGEIGQELHAAYTGTKGAVNALTKSMALDYAKYNIRVNAVSPSAVWTPMLEKWNQDQPNGTRESMALYLDAIHPIGYCPKGDVVADVCVFLVSDMARFITGCIMPVSGGAELGYRSVQQVSSVTKLELGE
jgi:NAD(P)-dependent dehydrogenase (short-subunit alcohol dehydrogenase family)